jgi:cell division protein FtsN
MLLAVGIVVGAGIAGLAWLATVKLPGADKPAAAASTAKPAAKPAPAKTESPDYTFYTVLPRSEVRVSEQDSKTAKPAANEVYVLQVGSFKQSADADRRRAELILMGQDAYVETVTLSGGEVWNRVLVGPFSDTTKANAARTALSANKVDSMLLKRGQ